MPTSAPSRRALLAVAAAALAPLAFLLPFSGTADAAALAPEPVMTSPGASESPSESPSPSPTPSPTCAPTDLSCHLPSPSATPSPTPSKTPKASATPTRTATASPTPRRTQSAQPESTYSVPAGSTDNPITGSIDIGGVKTDSPSPQPTLTPKESSSSSGSGDNLARLLLFVLGGAVLLGVSGATGLYLTRHRHDH